MRAKVPPVVVLLVVALLMRGAAALAPSLTIDFPGREALSKILFALGLVLGLTGIATFLKAGTSLNPHNVKKAAKLVSTGIYRITRNAMYLGLLFVLLSYGAKLGNLLSLGLTPLFVAWMNRFQIAAEEDALKEKFGIEYEEFARKTRRWL